MKYADTVAAKPGHPAEHLQAEEGEFEGVTNSATVASRAPQMSPTSRQTSSRRTGTHGHSGAPAHRRVDQEQLAVGLAWLEASARGRCGTRRSGSRPRGTRGQSLSARTGSDRPSSSRTASGTAQANSPAAAFPKIFSVTSQPLLPTHSTCMQRNSCRCPGSRTATPPERRSVGLISALPAAPDHDGVRQHPAW
jgi:hypothetical protein